MKKWLIWAIIFYVHALFFLYKGIDRVEGYNMNEYASSLNQHVFVGGDAYNYIINANIQTAFFVMAGAFFIAGTMMIIGGSIIKTIKEVKEESTVKVVA
ncbi:hypothetical protein AB3N04_12970 [Alkalihalophilus sp. As8PL]|uniref:Uncharacterized protein n=1 Tax=Alkalihalophilus sp. As8PL TaxID=3237103 RepID=A0AB39BPW2_9BACI